MLNILMVQLPVPNNPAANIPLAAGYLKAYAHAQGLLDRVQITIMPRDIADRAGDALLIDEIVRRGPDVLALSLYTWNSERSLFIAQQTKLHLPNLFVIVGGPEVQRDNDWVLRHPAVDVAVEGEGEQTFCEVVEGILEVRRQKSEVRRQKSEIRSQKSEVRRQKSEIGKRESGSGHQGAGNASQTAEVRQQSERVDGEQSTGDDSAFIVQHGALVPSPTADSDSSIGMEHAAFPLIPGTIWHVDDELITAPPRIALASLEGIPSPYELGYLEVRAGEMALVECSRWCPYGCTFCLYGRSMGTKLGGRMFSTERVLAEVSWAKAHGAGAIHFVEANLNLLPNFRDLMIGLQQINAVDPISLYAELRGEHLKADVVDALAQAGLRVAEVGLQSANRNALLAVGRRTNLEKWAAGTRRLYEHGIEVLLDVILGLPEDDRESTLTTITWIAEQGLGPYDVFTLQVLPGTGVRTDAERHGLGFQTRPPYYVLQTSTLDYVALRGLRWELREAAGLDPQAIEGLPQPSADVWLSPTDGPLYAIGQPIHTLHMDCAAPLSLHAWRQHGEQIARTIASHVVVHARHSSLAVIEAVCWPIAQANPTIHWDIIIDDPTVAAADLRDIHERWPHEIGYLDRVAVYRRPTPQPEWVQVSPRWWVLADWQSDLDALRFEGIADVVWRITADDLSRNIEAVTRRGGTGVVVAGALSAELHQHCADADVQVLNDKG